MLTMSFCLVIIGNVKGYTFNTKYKIILLKSSRRRKNKMKKSIIAAGAASVALAAMPIVGAFATVSSYGQITDKIQTTVGESCTMSADDGGTGFGITVPGDSTAVPPVAAIYGTTVTLTKSGNDLSPGEVSDQGTGTPLTITCNSADGWNFNAQATVLTNDKGYTIPVGQYVSAADHAEDSSLAETTTSVWSARFSLSGTSTGAQLVTGADAFKSTPITTTSQTVVAENTETSHGADPATADAVSGAIVTPYYMVFVDSAQEQGTYVGTITYTLTYGS